MIIINPPNAQLVKQQTIAGLIDDSNPLMQLYSKLYIETAINPIKNLGANNSAQFGNPIKTYRQQNFK